MEMNPYISECTYKCNWKTFAQSSSSRQAGIRNRSCARVSGICFPNWENAESSSITSNAKKFQEQRCQTTAMNQQSCPDQLASTARSFVRLVFHHEVWCTKRTRWFQRFYDSMCGQNRIKHLAKALQGPNKDRIVKFPIQLSTACIKSQKNLTGLPCVFHWNLLGGFESSQMCLISPIPQDSKALPG